MAEIPDLPSELEVDDLDLAEPVSQRVQIRSIILVDCSAKRAPSVKYKDLRPEISVSEISFGRPSESKNLFVKPSFSLRMVKRGSEELAEEQQISSQEHPEDPVLAIEATFVLTYTVDRIDDLNEANFHAFATTNGVFNAWPYWREFVSSTVARMGLPPIAVPVYRI